MQPVYVARVGMIPFAKPGASAPYRRMAAQATRAAPDVPLALRYFGGAGIAHMQKYGTKLATFAKVRAKASLMRRTIRSQSFATKSRSRMSWRRRCSFRA